MRKASIIAASLVFALSAGSSAFAGSDSGQGDGKGRSGPAGAISNGEPGEKGDVASGAGENVGARDVTGGWGSVGGVNNPNARSFGVKGDPPSGRGNNRGRDNPR